MCNKINNFKSSLVLQEKPYENIRTKITEERKNNLRI